MALSGFSLSYFCIRNYVVCISLCFVAPFFITHDNEQIRRNQQGKKEKTKVPRLLKTEKYDGNNMTVR